MIRQKLHGDLEAMNQSLCSLFDQFGYTRYKMSKFEEYDLYANNRDFWDSAGIITFNDTNGRLMALKPDVTLSIVKNIRLEKESVRKLYYYENVYRTTRPSDPFREIPQAGLEALGDVDDYCIYEVLKLAAKSLSLLGRDYILQISDLTLLCSFLESIGLKEKALQKALIFTGEKNLHELKKHCESEGVIPEDIDLLSKLINIHGTPGSVLSESSSILKGRVPGDELERFTSILTALGNKEEGGRIRIDFSIVNDTKYYTGFVFKGYIEGAPESVLSGGQYDILMKRMKKNSKAIGFAIYLDVLEDLLVDYAEYDVDTILIYDENASITDIESVVKDLARNGEYIMVQKSVPKDTKYKKLMKLENGKVSLID